MVSYEMAEVCIPLEDLQCSLPDKHILECGKGPCKKRLVHMDLRLRKGFDMLDLHRQHIPDTHHPCCIPL